MSPGKALTALSTKEKYSEQPGIVLENKGSYEKEINLELKKHTLLIEA